MKSKTIIIIVTAIFLTIPQISTGFPGKLSIKIANGEWPPYFSTNLKHGGVVSRIVKEAFEKEGIAVEFIFLPWKRGLVEASAGKWTGALGWLKTEERKEDFYFTKPIMDITPVFFQRKDYKIAWNTMEDLKGKTIGATYGFFYGDKFTEAEEKQIISVDRTTEPIHNLNKLIYKRIDLAAVEKNVGLYLLFTQFDKAKSDLVEPQQKLLHSNPAYLLISKKAENADDIVLLFNKGLEKLTNDGLIEKYWMDFKQGNF